MKVNLVRCPSLFARGIKLVSGHSNSPIPFWPARILEIWRPRLNAWLNSSRVWNSETKGNHDRKPMGRKRMRPIIFSYDLPSSMMESHSMVLLINGEHACPICKQEIIKIIRQDWDRWSLSGQNLLLEKNIGTYKMIQPPNVFLTNALSNQLHLFDSLILYSSWHWTILT